MTILKSLALAGLTFAASFSAAAAGFSGPLAPANWTKSVSGPAFGSTVDTSSAPASILLIGGNDASGVGCPDGTVSGFLGSCEIDYKIGSGASYSFQWAYSTTDISPQYDQFGVIVDGVKTELVADGGDVTQSGSYSVRANSSFGWYINCTDCTSGGAIVTISNVAAIPEPGAWALLALGLPVALGLSRKARRC